MENLIDKFQEALAAGPAGNSGSSSRAPSESAEPQAIASVTAVDIESGEPESSAANPDNEDGTSGAANADADKSVVAVDGEETKEEATSWDDAAEAEWGHLSPHQHFQLAKLRLHFHKDVRKQLYGDVEDKQFFESLKQVC